MTSDQVVLFGMSIFSILFSIFLIKVLPGVIKINWNKISEKTEKKLTLLARIVGIFGLLVGIFCLIMGFIFKKL